MRVHISWRTVFTGLAVALLAIAAAACGDDDDEDGGDGDGGTVVDVTLKEFEVLPAPDSAPSGDVTFRVTNVGPDDPHELVVMKTELAPAALPTVEDGSVDEEGEGVALIGEVEDLDVDSTEDITLNLEAGSYVLLCNIVEEEDGETESHYLEGMRVAFTVE